MNKKVNITEKVKFSAVTDLLEKIHRAKTIQRKSDILKGYIESFGKFQREFIKTNGKDCNASFYPIFRLFLPNIDREREAYGIKTTTMGRLYVRILAIDQNGDIGKMLMRQHETNKQTPGDYAQVVYDVMKNRCNETCNLTVFDVNQHLDNIAYCYQNNDRKKIDDELIKMINGMTAVDQKWLIRIILKHLNLGLGQQKIFSIYHPQAKDFYAQYSHLSRVCECIENGEQLKPKGTIEPMQPFRPMLCQRFDISQLEHIIKNKEYYVETKMDGERFQIHLSNGEYKYFSRNGYDFTNVYGSNVIEGILTPAIHRLFKIHVQNLILDGEMMVWNKEEQIYHTKGENFDVKSLKRNDPILRPCFCVYDILYLNDNCLTGKPYAERTRLLGSIISEETGFLTLCKRDKIRDSDHILECLNAAIDSKEEGVVIKEADSVYAPGERNAGWCKIKPDYIAGLVSDFDLLIIGGYYNRRKTFVTSFLLGVLKKANGEHDNDNITLYAVTRVSLGLGYAQLIELNNKLKPFWNQCKTIKEGRSTKTVNPPNMEIGNSSPDIWIEPKHSIILEVKASELTKSSSFGTAYTLRFPRIVSIRSDKIWSDCCSLSEFENLCQSTSSKVTKITKRHITLTDINESTTSKVPVKRSRNQQSTSTKSISSAIKFSADLDVLIKPIDDICHGKDFCLLSTTKGMPTLNELKRMVLMHGGQVVENPSSSTFLSIAGDRTFKVKKIIETRAYNVASVEWLIKAQGGTSARTRLLDLGPTDMLVATPEFEQKFQQKFDEFGDSYMNAISEKDLKNILSKMDVKNLPEASRSDFYTIEKELHPNKTNSNFFRLATAFFYNPTNVTVDRKLEYCRFLFRSKGGICIDQLDNENDNDENSFDCLSHIIVNRNTFDPIEFCNFNQFCGCDLKKCRVVSYDWILHSCQNGKKISEKLYFVDF